jgi:transposase-like protein
MIMHATLVGESGCINLRSFLVTKHFAYRKKRCDRQRPVCGACGKNPQEVWLHLEEHLRPLIRNVLVHLENDRN